MAEYIVSESNYTNKMMCKLDNVQDIMIYNAFTAT